MNRVLNGVTVTLGLMLVLSTVISAQSGMMGQRPMGQSEEAAQSSSGGIMGQGGMGIVDRIAKVPVATVVARLLQEFSRRARRQFEIFVTNGFAQRVIHPIELGKPFRRVGFGRIPRQFFGQRWIIAGVQLASCRKAYKSKKSCDQEAHHWTTLCRPAAGADDRP